MKPVIQTYSGGIIDFVEPRNSQFNIEDIAHGLANTCRYSGQCKRHYNVATHSVVVTLFVPDHLQFEALLHDATEAFMADIPTPLKQLLRDYQTMEHRMEKAIREHFGLPADMSPEVKRADHIALAIEKPILMGKSAIHWDLPDIDPMEARVIISKSLINCATIESSKRLFLDTFNELKEKQNV